MLTFSQLLRFATAAGMYLLLMWGYMELPSAQWYAAFLALILCSMLVFWVTESVVAANAATRHRPMAAVCSHRFDQHLPAVSGRPGLTMPDWQASPEESVAGDLTASVQDIEITVARLDALKSELTQQYAQFGRDQSALNAFGLGTWNGKRDFRDPI